MTFAIVLANADQIIQVSDRRVTAAEGKLVDDAFMKVGHAICDDASFLYCFTGIAAVGPITRTTDWLRSALRRGGRQHEANYQQIDEDLTAAATQLFQRSRFLQQQSSIVRRLTIMLTGYTFDGYMVNSLISNFQDFSQLIDHPEAQGQFALHRRRSTDPAIENPIMVQAIGQSHALTSGDVAELKKMLSDRAPAEAIRRKAVSLVQEISDRPNTNGTVGKRLNTARLPRTDFRFPVVGYASDIVEHVLPLLDQVVIKPNDQGIEIANVQMSVPKPVVFPKVHRNALCPCGSGKRYRDCHRERR